ncbi:hypothetical protein [Draconibacterium mangrovi]|uniref:hypothetical protein n=1 Tax=Draconibacterium mangrovi TaxID=2697469 RepID=UPI0013D1C3E7|nr:hypothetical protein [Draconibacterium mangrovi]
MKRIIFLLIGIFIMATACQDDFVETDNDLSQVEKSAKYEKIKTFEVRGYVNSIPNMNGPMVSCLPEGSELALAETGWVNGHVNIFGKIVQEKSTYWGVFCEMNMTPDGPVVLITADVELERSNGDMIFLTSYMILNPFTNEISGHNEYTGGTGRFEGVTGECNIVNGVLDPETGIASWEETGEITLLLK